MLDRSTPDGARIAERLDREEYAYFTSVRPDGRPHTVPVCFLWDGATILIFSLPDTVKCRNIRQNPQVSFTLEIGRITPENVPITVEGMAALVDEPGIEFMMPAYAAKYAPLADRLGATLEGLARMYTQAIRLTPTRFRLDP